MKIMVVILKLVAKNQAAYYIAHCVGQEVMRVEWQTLESKREKERLRLQTTLNYFQIISCRAQFELKTC